MNEVRTLIEKFWICRDTDKETFYKVKRDIPNFQKFVREQLGWKLVHTENLLKLEKRPAHAEPFMGIEEFTDIRDYCILCVVLMYLEDKEDQEQFLLSELIDYVETQLKAYMEIDWTSFTQRKSLVRVLQYMERLSMLRVYEGSSEGFSAEAGQEVLYENTGYSKYFATSFPTDISGYESWEDFEKADFEEFDEIVSIVSWLYVLLFIGRSTTIRMPFTSRTKECALPEIWMRIWGEIWMCIKMQHFSPWRRMTATGQCIREMPCCRRRFF